MNSLRSTELCGGICGLLIGMRHLELGCQVSASFDQWTRRLPGCRVGPLLDTPAPGKAAIAV